VSCEAIRRFGERAREREGDRDTSPTTSCVYAS
jgi:hypothetical protein